MSGTLPSFPNPKESSLVSAQPVIKSISESGKRQARVVAGHLWEAKLKYPVMIKSEFSPVFAFCAKQRGDSFFVELPPHNNASGTISGTVLTNGAATSGDNMLVIDGLGATDTFLAGDFFTLATHSKAYMVTDNAVAVAGAVTIGITPPLIKDVIDGTALTYNAVKFTMAFKSAPKELKVTAPTLAAYSVDLVESIV